MRLGGSSPDPTRQREASAVMADDGCRTPATPLREDINIGTMLCKGKRVAFKSEVLDSGFPISGYPEIDNVQSDLATILY